MNTDLANSQGQGFIKLWYSMKNWEWSDDPNTVCLWVHLLLEANWQTKEWKGREIKRGQLIFGRKAWSDKTGLSEQQLRTSLNKLISTSSITSESTNQFTILTIVNYDKFQCKKEDATNDQPASQPTSNQPTNQRVTTPKDCSEGSDCSDGHLTPYNPPGGGCGDLPIESHEIPSVPKGKKKAPSAKSAESATAICIPEYIPEDLLLEFFAYRKEIKKPMTDRAKELLISKIIKLYNDGNDPTKLLETAIERGWQTVFETHETKGRNANGENWNNLNGPNGTEHKPFGGHQQDTGHAPKLSDYERKIIHVRRNLGLGT
ncbi:MAG: hypothetical protein ACKO37_00865 [Vampirovibrionales bacterium]